MYKKLIKFYEDGSLSFKYVITFNMDEYVGESVDEMHWTRRFDSDNSDSPIFKSSDKWTVQIAAFLRNSNFTVS